MEYDHGTGVQKLYKRMVFQLESPLLKLGDFIQDEVEQHDYHIRYVRVNQIRETREVQF